VQNGIFAGKRKTLNEFDIKTNKCCHYYYQN